MTNEVGNMSGNMIKIYKKSGVRGEDGYKVFSIRIKEETVAALDDLAMRSNRSRNDLINVLLEYSIKNAEVVE